MIVYLHKIKYYHIWTIYIELVWLCKLGNILYLSKFKKYNSQSEMGLMNVEWGIYIYWLIQYLYVIIQIILDMITMKYIWKSLIYHNYQPNI